MSVTMIGAGVADSMHDADFVRGNLRSAVAGEDSATAGAIARRLRDDGLLAESDFGKGGLWGSVAVYVAEASGRPCIARGSVETFAANVGAELKAAFGFLRRATRAVRARSAGGSIVFVAPFPLHDVAHDAVRQGLRLLVKSAALELGPERIRVNIVLPGVGVSPLPGSVGPSDIADAVAFLASDRARFMTGADLVVDGGRLAR